MSHHVCEMLNSLYSQLPDDDNEGNQRSGGKLLYETYCPKIEDKYQRCNSDNDRIKAGFIYLVGQLFDNVNSEGEHEDQKSRYVYYGFMWMSYKLQQSNRNSGNSITLYEFINDHVLKDEWYEVVEDYVNPKVPLITKEADIDLMNDVYYILKEMCKFFSNNHKSFDYLEDFSKYYDSVKNFGEKILKKKSNNGNIDNIDQIYVDLYDTLKNVYNEYRNYYYVKNIQYDSPPEIPDIEEIKKNFTPDLKTSDSQDSTKGNIKPQDGDGNSDQQQPEQQPPSEPESKEPAAPPSEPVPPLSSQLPSKPTTVISPPVLPKGPENPTQQSQSQLSLQKDNELKTPQTEGPSNQNGSEDSKNGQMSLDSGKGGTTTNKGDSGGTDNRPIGTQDDQGKSSGGSGDQSNTGSQSVGQDDKQENQDGTSVNQISGSESPGGESKDGTQNKTDNVDHSMPGHQQPNPQGDPSQQGKPDTANPLDQTGTPDTSEGSFGFGSSFLSLLSNGTNFFNRASDFIDQNQQRFNDAKDKISNVYNDTLDNLKIVYNASSDYFSDMINSITNQLNQDDPPKSGNSGDKLPQSNDQSQKTGDPPQIPSKDPPSTPPSNPIPDPTPNPPLPPPAPPEQKQLPPPSSNLPQFSSQQNQSPPQLQSTTLQTPQVSPTTQKTTDQLVKSPSPGPILRTPWNIIPTTWNGSGNCKPKIRFMNSTLVCCTSEQCSLTGISVTLILIPIILLIAYKYLSFGSSKKSEKKNMKRVIKLVDGSKKTQIIINSYYRKKNLKPVINSVGGKKGPLLNIYKLMQVNPMPFINLFFLLIFFVYKRKENLLEL